MSIALSERARTLPASATVEVTKRAAELRAEGVDVLAFSVGEPDFGPPAHVLSAFRDAATRPEALRYTSVAGLPSLRAAIVEDSARRRGYRHRPSEVVVSAGGKHALYNVCQVLFDTGDEVLIPSPHWVSYPAQVVLAGGTPVTVETQMEDGFQVSPERLEAAITSRTRGVVLCSPSNPSGAVYTRSQWEALAEVLRAHDVWIILDEIYGHLVYEGAHVSLLEVAPDLHDRIVIVDGVSKGYAMTGFRIGWLLAPPLVAQACERFQGQVTTNVATPCQVAAQAALEGDQTHFAALRELFRGRRDQVVAGLGAMDGVELSAPAGAFYVFPRVSALIGRRAPNGQIIEDDIALATYLLEAAHCALVPGTAFGAPGHLRLSYAASESLLEKGIQRLGDAIAALR